MSSKNDRQVLTEGQMETLADPLRSELVLALRAFGPASVAELARRVAGNAKSLYYPLRKLVSAGLVEVVGSQQGKRRSEAIYGVTAEHLEIAPDASLATRSRLVKATLRAAEQEFLQAQSESPPPPALRISRNQFWLESQDREAFLARLAELEEEFCGRSQAGRGELLLWTSLVTPKPPRD